ncbi:MULTISPECIES: ATP-binding protein [Nostoc]|uniref:histidine kinase n=1 Tax=Nostoc paludosum FACHB-159 TaxID=2692908 RepID=A0ABR8KIH5_9NOSO|nr:MULTISPECIES: ATP-binding protein [Nostoc]MBD2683026.1 HAMP domain-containing protein [Nostoc sp. FACHB-857]MBD2739367.1 HAMP domain-containing protein [Nostoc paludosum FACHB-159]
MRKIRLGVGQRISLGYAIALAIAVSGTVAGFRIGHSYHQLADEREAFIRNEVELLHRLQTGILQARTHQQQLIPLMENRKEYQHEYAHLLHHKGEIEHFLRELKTFIAKESNWLGEVDSREIPKFFQTYNNVPSLYFQELDRRMQQIQSLNLVLPKDIEQAQKILLEFTNSQLALKYDGISDDLVSIIEDCYKEANKAKELSQESSSIAQKVVIGSILLSVTISILLAILTTRSIAHPIQRLTSVARRSTQESNFELQVPIERDDEIGILAQSFNQLIASVQKLLQQQQVANKQLAAYNETLEQKVEQRTEQLKEKNLHLQNVLEELQRTQLQIVQSEKMSALGQMVAGVAHEINNPVNFIHGNLTHVQEYTQNLLDFVQLYQQYYPEPIPEILDEAEAIDLEFMQQDLPKMLDSMKVGTNRIRQIVLSLRNFSRTDEAEFKTVDIHEGIDSTLLILQHRLKEQAERSAISVIKDYGNLPWVECYPGQLNQVLMNILANAIDALEESKIPNPQINIRTDKIDSHWVQIAIADNGQGIPEAIQKQIFHPFFTTKPVGKGTGIGMSISYEIVTQKHGGRLECLSTHGKGAEFMIQIPIIQNR